MLRGDDSRIRDDIERWQKILHAKGWGAPAGRWNSAAPAGATRQYIFETECALAGAPRQCRSA